MIRTVKISDAMAICGIYNHYVKHTVISFEENPVSVKEMESRIVDISSVYPWLVWEEARELIGYAYVNKWKDRGAYGFSVEHSIYLKQGHEGKGLGTCLLTRLLEEVKKTMVHAVIAGITLPNKRSIALHERFGFIQIAQFKEIGFKLNQWLDVGYWELLL
ncbi:MAG: GNAT family N-acetyltransferase [Treponema sp.]|jgi:phosphinothricin acetyltransferase|nr:GNAT family N-acetyltransferase [Treponema sp.]